MKRILPLLLLFCLVCSISYAQIIRGNGSSLQRSGENLTNLNVDGSIYQYNAPIGGRFNVKDYGAKGDGKRLLDGVFTSGSTTFQSLSAGFSSGDVGKVISIVSGATTISDFTTTIASINSDTSVELTAAPTQTQTNYPFTYGTDDTAAINAAKTAAFNNKGGIIYFPAGIYIVNGAYNSEGTLSQIGIPEVDISSTGTTISLTFEGENIPVNHAAPAGSTGKQSVIYSTRYGTNGSYSVIGAKQNVSETFGFTYLKVNFNNINIRTVQDPTNSAVDMYWVSLVEQNGTLLIEPADMGRTTTPGIQRPTHSDSWALKMPTSGNDATNFWNTIIVRGFYNGIDMGEHTTINNAFIVLCVYGIRYNNIAIPGVSNSIDIERTIYPVTIISNVAYRQAPIYINLLGLEHYDTGWFVTVTDITATDALAIGKINVYATRNGLPDVYTTSGFTAPKVPLGNVHSVTPATSSSHAFVGVSLNAECTTCGTNMYLYSLPRNTPDILTSTALTSGNRFGSVAFGGSYDTANNTALSASIGAYVAGNWSVTSTPSDMAFFTTSSGSTVRAEALRITAGKNVGIGTTVPTAMLHVGSAPTKNHVDGTNDILVKDAIEADGNIYVDGSIYGYGTGFSTGKGVCWHSTSRLGYCSTVLDASGNCTCN